MGSREQGSTLATRLAAGDPPALEEAYRTLGPGVMAYARRYVGPADAQDVVQRVFLDVWRSAGRYDPSRPLRAWVFTIARRRVIDELRRRRHVVVSLDEVRDLASASDGRDVATAYADAMTVRGVLGQLPEHQRVVLELAYFAGHTQSEIAARLGVPLGTVKARTARGLRRLAVLLDDGDGDEPAYQ